MFSSSLVPLWAHGLGIITNTQNTGTSTAPLPRCMYCHANLSLSLRAFRLWFGVPFLEHTGLIKVVPHEEYLAVTKVLRTGLSGYRGSSHE